MGILKGVLVVWTMLLHASHTTTGMPQGHQPPPGTVIQGDVVRILDHTPTVYIARQIYEQPSRPPIPHQFYVRHDPPPVSEPHGTTGWTPVVPPSYWRQQNPVHGLVLPPPYHPSTVMYPLEKSQNRPYEREQRHPPPSIPEPHLQDFMREDVDPRFAVQEVPTPETTTVATTQAMATEIANEEVGAGHPTASTEASITADSAMQITPPGHPTNNVSESDVSPFRVTEQSHSDASLETSDAAATQTVVPTEVRTVATPGGEQVTRNYALASGAVAGIVVGAIAIVALLTGLATYIVLRRPFVKLLNGNDKSSAENVAYIDDSFRGGYMNTHVELPKESSEEMTSLDNDSFLNSLEAVTIQNYWADSATTKNTNV